MHSRKRWGCVRVAVAVGATLIGWTPTSPAAAATCSPSSTYSQLIAGTPGIVGYWRLSDPPGSTTACDYVGSDTGTYAGGVTLGQPGAISGDPATSASFDGTGTSTVADSPALDTGDSFTIEAWVKRSAASNYNQLIADKQSGSWVLIFNTQNQLVLRRSGYDSVAWSAQTISDTSSWHYVAATKSGSSIHLYIDGNDVTGAVSNETITNSTSPLVIGHWLDGNVQDLAIYNTALTPSQIASHYQAGATAPSPPPATCSPNTAYSKLVAGTGGVAGYWRLSDPPGSTSVCASVGSNPGSYSGGVTLGQPGAIAGDPATSASFDGSGTASVPDNPSLDNGDTFSVEAWVKRASVSNYNQLIADKQSGAWALIFNAADQLVLRRSGYDSIAWSWQRIRDMSSWHYIAATKNGSSIHLYIDGNDVTGAVSNDTITNSSDPLVIGHWLQGNVQDVAVYKSALTPSQIASHYQAGAGHAPVPPTGGKGATLGNLPVAGGGVPVIAAAGDISCSPGDADWNGGAGDANGCREAATANLMSGGQLAGSNLSAVLPLGDEQYEGGAAAEFAAGYAPTWGALKSTSYPVPGEHDYFTPAGVDYYDYFNGPGVVSGRAGNEGAGYYSFNLGGWHIVALNSECGLLPGGCGSGSPEETWLKHDLSTDSAHCTLAYWNQPVFYSGPETGGQTMKQMFADLYNAHATLVLNGHEHQYERFAPQNANGQSDPTHGIVEIVDGTGGRSLDQFGTVAPNSVVRNNTTYGVLELTLLATSYNFRFVPAAGGTFTDSGSGPCRN